MKHPIWPPLDLLTTNLGVRSSNLFGRAIFLPLQNNDGYRGPVATRSCPEWRRCKVVVSPTMRSEARVRHGPHGCEV